MTSPVVTFFSEARLVRSGAQCLSTNKDLAGTGWTRGLLGVPGLRLAARVRDDEGQPAGDLWALDGSVAPLPYYVGARGTILALPRLAQATHRAVRESDVVVARAPGVIGLMAAVMATVHRTPLATEVVGDIEDVLLAGIAGAPGRRMAPIAGWVTRRAVGRSRAARYVTQHTLQHRYPARRGAPTVGFSSIVLPADWLGAPCGPQSPVPTILAIGSQEQDYKGHDLLIRALLRLRASSPDLELVLVGEGRRQAYLRDLADELGVADRVTFAGYVADRAALRELVDRAWVFAMPSRTEGLPRALVEAMARSRACVGASVGGIPELIEARWQTPVDDVDALVERISTLLADEGLREDTGRRNAEVASAYQVESIEGARQQWVRMVTALIPRR